ncbi:MAG: hypothetical protein AAGB34_03515 [Planctomycetota bacterium]
MLLLLVLALYLGTWFFDFGNSVYPLLLAVFVVFPVFGAIVLRMSRLAAAAAERWCDEPFCIYCGYDLTAYPGVEQQEEIQCTECGKMAPLKRRPQGMIRDGVDSVGRE